MKRLLLCRNASLYSIKCIEYELFPLLIDFNKDKLIKRTKAFGLYKNSDVLVLHFFIVLIMNISCCFLIINFNFQGLLNPTGLLQFINMNTQNTPSLSLKSD